MPPYISIEDLADGAAHVPILGAGGTTVDPLLVVALEPEPKPAALTRAIELADRCDRLLVGWAPDDGGELAPHLDLTVSPRESGPETVAADDPAGCLADLGAAASANPQAALVLGTVLRMTERLPVGQALDVESLAYSTLLGGPEFARWLRGRGPRPLPPDAVRPVLADRRGQTLHVTLNRPERRNAYGRQLRDALVEALQVAEADPSVTRVVLDGAGPAFCSGGDLAEFGTTPDLTLAHLIRTRGGAGRLLHALRDRTEVRVHGACVGAGIELPAFAGTVVADPGATFRLPEVGMGLIPGAGGTVSIPRRIGRWRTLHLSLSGTALPARQAAEWGLVDHLGAP